MSRLLNLNLTCILFLIVLAGPAQANTRSVTFVNPGGEEGFWGTVSEVMQQASRQLDIELEVLYSNRNRILMLEHAAEIVSRADLPDVVIIVNELEQGSQLLRILADANIPVYFLLNTISDAQFENISQEMNSRPRVVGSIVPENFRAGYEMMTQLVKESRLDMPEKRVAVLSILGDQITPAALEREAGMRQAIDELDNVQLARSFSVLWDPAVAYKRVSTAMSLIEFDVIWAANDELALASKSAVTRNCKNTKCKNILIAGLNWSSEGLKAVKSRELVSSHGGHFIAGGYAMAAINRYLHDQKMVSKVTLLMESIDSTNEELLDRLIETDSWGFLDFKSLAKSLDDMPREFNPISMFEKGQALSISQGY